MKVLVTGGTGFLGRHVVRRLVEAGDLVRVLSRPRGDTAAPGREELFGQVEHVTGDLRDRDAIVAAVSGVEAICHCAARVATGGTWAEFEEVTVRGTARLLEAAVAAGVDRFVHVSSAGIYALGDRQRVAETAPFDDGTGERGHYTRAKIEAERLVWRWRRQTGLAVTVIRPGLLYGPGRPPFIGRVCLRLPGGARLLVADLGQVLPLAHVKSVAEAIHLALRCAAAGRAYNIVEDGIRQGEYLAWLRRFGLVRGPVFRLSPRLVAPVVSLLETPFRWLGARPPLSRHQLDRALASVTYDTSRARDELGWRPTITLCEALAELRAAQR